MIGIFDSGIGGLSVLREIHKQAPTIDVVYFGDVANMPYGLKSDAEITQLSLNAIALLRSYGCTTIVSACNSVSASIIRPILDLLEVKDSSVIEMIAPAIAYLQLKKINNVVLLGTPATIRSGLHKKIAASHGIAMHTIPCETLAQSIEAGAPKIVIAKIIRTILQRIPPTTKNIILGCTHYPFVIKEFRSEALRLRMHVKFIDPSSAVATAAVKQHKNYGNGSCRIISSQHSVVMEKYLKKIPITTGPIEIVNPTNSYTNKNIP